MRQLTSLYHLIIAACLYPILGYAAPNTPEPGYIPRPENTLKLHKEPDATILQEKPVSKQLTDPTSNEVLVIRQFVFLGNASFSNETLLEVTSPYLNKAISVADLLVITQRISKLYQSKGFFLAQAYIPEQDVIDGVVQINIIEGNVDDVRISSDSDLDLPFLSQIVTNNGDFKHGSTVKDSNLVKGVSLVNGLPGVSASATLEPGSTIGSTNATILIQAEPSIGGYLNLNTYGNRYTNREVMQAGAYLNNPAKRGDRLSFRFLDSRNERQRSVGINYQIPVHYSGTTAHLDISHLDYRLGREFRQIGAVGTNIQGYIALDHPIIRGPGLSLSSRVAYTYKSINDEIKAFDLSNKRSINEVDFSIYGDWRDNWLNGYNIAGITIKSGEVQFKDRIADAIDNATLKTEGKFEKLNLSISRQQPITDHLFLMTNAEAQITNNNLDSIEKIVVGGISRWRPFAELPTSADQGAIIGMELRYIKSNLSMLEINLSSISPYLFMDFGKGKLNHTPLTAANSVYSKHFGIGVDSTLNKNLGFTLVTSYQSRDVESQKNQSSTRLWGEVQFNF